MSKQNFRELYLQYIVMAQNSLAMDDGDEYNRNRDQAEVYFELMGSPYPLYPDADEPDHDSLSQAEIDAWRAKAMRFMPQAAAWLERNEDLSCVGGDHE
jgi:hypothetical protein